MWPMLGRIALQYGIPTISGVMTAKDIYEKTGDIGKAVVGGGVTGVGTWGLGKGGSKLASMAGNKLWPNATPGLVGGGTARAMNLVSQGIPLATQAVLGAVPAMAGGLAASVTPGVFGPGGGRRAQDALSGSMQLLGAGQQLTAPQVTGEWNPQGVPSTSAYGPDSYLRVADPFGPVAGQVLAGKLNALGQLEQQKILAPYALGMMDKVTDKDMLRQAAMAQLKTQLAQGAQAMSQAQLGAQALAQQGMGGMISAAAQRGGYV